MSTILLYIHQRTINKLHFIANYFIRWMTVEIHMRLQQKRKIYDKVITGLDLKCLLNNEFFCREGTNLLNIDRFDSQ